MQIGRFFKKLTKYAIVDKPGDPPKVLNQVVDWSIFAPTIVEATPVKAPKGLGGRLIARYCFLKPSFCKDSIIFRISKSSTK